PVVIDRFHGEAYSVAFQVVSPENRDFLIGCSPEIPSNFDSSCAENFLADVGFLIFRRDLSEAHLKQFMQIALNATEQFDDFYTGLAYALAGMLVSPEFMLFVEE